MTASGDSHAVARHSARDGESRITLDAYIRVSDVRGRSGETFISPTVQREKIETYLRLHGHEVGRVWEELDESGGRMDRPLFQKVMRRIESGETGGVIVAKLDRFARTLTGALSAIADIERAGGQLIVVEEQFDTTTPIGRAIMRILLVLAELQREQIGASWRDAQTRAVVDRRVHLTPRVPLGYRRDHKGAPLELDDQAAPVVAELFQRAARGARASELAQLLNDAGVVTSYGNRQWSPETARRLLKNRVYLGEARGSGDIVRACAHPAIVDEHLFQRANRLAVSRTIDPRATSLLAGIARCAGCRYGMTFDGKSYRCKRVHAAGVCLEPAIVRATLLEPHVVDAFLAIAGDTIVGGGDARVDRLGTALAAAEAELAAWRDDQAILDLDRGVYRDGLAARVQRRDRARTEFEDAARGVSPSRRLRDAWADLPTAEKRSHISGAIDCVFVSRGCGDIDRRVVVLERGAAPDDLPRRGRLTPLRSFTPTEEATFDDHDR